MTTDQQKDIPEGTQGVPPIETWWAELPIEETQALKDSPVLTTSILRRIAEITGADVPDGEVLLSEHDRGFVRTQSELVD